MNARTALSERALEVFRSIGEHADRLGEQELVGFLPSKGDLYDCQLMVVGRAAYGWSAPAIRASKLTNENAISTYSEAVWDSVSARSTCPMSWVSKGRDVLSGYNPNGSAFWRVTRDCVTALGIASAGDEKWPSHLVWSNLYKISPWEPGNPGGPLCQAQINACIDLLRAEIDFFKPRRLLFITGGWVNDFNDILTMKNPLNWHNIVEGKGEIRNKDGISSKYVVAGRPEGGEEAKWVQEVVSAFEELGVGREHA